MTFQIFHPYSPFSLEAFLYLNSLVCFVKNCNINNTGNFLIIILFTPRILIATPHSHPKFKGKWKTVQEN